VDFSQCLNFIPYRTRAILILSSVFILFIGQKCLFNEVYDQERVVMACVWYISCRHFLKPTLGNLEYNSHRAKKFSFKKFLFFSFLVALMQGKDNPALTPEEYRAPAITFLIHHVQTY
jgi:hypothetical protein